MRFIRAILFVVAISNFAAGSAVAEETSSGLGDNSALPVFGLLIIGAMVVPPALNLYDITHDKPSVVKGTIGAVSGGFFVVTATNQFLRYGSTSGTKVVFAAGAISLALGAAAIYLDVTREDAPVSVEPTVGFDGRGVDVGMAASVRF